jgi:hypothetical protein
MMADRRARLLLIANYDETARAMAGYRLCFSSDSFSSLDDAHFQ